MILRFCQVIVFKGHQNRKSCLASIMFLYILEDKKKRLVNFGFIYSCNDVEFCNDYVKYIL